LVYWFTRFVLTKKSLIFVSVFQNEDIMQTVSIEIINPKVLKLLNDLAELKLIRTKEPSLTSNVIETHWASEYVLAKDWLNPKEDEAWKDL